jgi:hypothetical protein
MLQKVGICVDSTMGEGHQSGGHSEFGGLGVGSIVDLVDWAVTSDRVGEGIRRSNDDNGQSSVVLCAG